MPLEYGQTWVMDVRDFGLIENLKHLNLYNKFTSISSIQNIHTARQRSSTGASKT